MTGGLGPGWGPLIHASGRTKFDDSGRRTEDHLKGEKDLQSISTKPEINVTIDPEHGVDQVPMDRSGRSRFKIPSNLWY